MKKILLILAIIFPGYTIVNAQQIDLSLTNKDQPAITNTVNLPNNSFLKNNPSASAKSPEKGYDFYNTKSRNQRIIGLSLLGAGLVLGVSGILVSSNNNNTTDYVQRDRTISTLFILSGATGIASIPFMILAHDSKNKARAALSGQKTFIPGKGNSYVTGLTVSIPIGK